MDYYEILHIPKFTNSIKDIKQAYYSLSILYHPDKNKGDDSYFKKINEAHEILSDEIKKIKYDLELRFPFFKNIELSENDYEIIHRYYSKITTSNEYKLFHLLYKSLPKDIQKKMSSTTNHSLYISPKWIDISSLDKNTCVHLYVNMEESYKDTIKTIFIKTKYNSICYLFIRYFNDTLIIDNKDCFLTLCIHTKNKDNFYRKDNDLYCLIPKESQSLDRLTLPDNQTICMIYNSFEGLGFSYKYNSTIKGKLILVKY